MFIAQPYVSHVTCSRSVDTAIALLQELVLKTAFKQWGFYTAVVQGENTILDFTVYVFRPGPVTAAAAAACSAC